MFVIGCSFTHWLWPTWADIISKEYHIELHNYGAPGHGNQYIMLVLDQLTRKHNIGKNDLVMIMWSSFHRNSFHNVHNDNVIDYLTNPDKQLDYQPGLVFNWKSSCDLIAGYIDQYGIQDNCYDDDRGHLIKNCGYISNVSNVLENAAYDSAQMLSVCLDNQHAFDASLNTDVNDVLELYSDLPGKMLGDSLYQFLNYQHEDKWWYNSNIPVDQHPGDDHIISDYHPRSIQYFNYLTTLGLELSDNTKQWCDHHDQIVMAETHSSRLQDSDEWPFSSPHRS